MRIMFRILGYVSCHNYAGHTHQEIMTAYIHPPPPAKKKQKTKK